MTRLGVLGCLSMGCSSAPLAGGECVLHLSGNVADDANTPYDTAFAGAMLIPITLTDALTITNAAVEFAGGLTVGVNPLVGSAKIAIDEALTTKFCTVTCSVYVAPSSITTHK